MKSISKSLMIAPIALSALTVVIVSCASNNNGGTPLLDSLASRLKPLNEDSCVSGTSTGSVCVIMTQNEKVALAGFLGAKPSAVKTNELSREEGKIKFITDLVSDYNSNLFTAKFPGARVEDRAYNDSANCSIEGSISSQGSGRGTLTELAGNRRDYTASASSEISASGCTHEFWNEPGVQHFHKTTGAIHAESTSSGYKSQGLANSYSTTNRWAFNGSTTSQVSLVSIADLTNIAPVSISTEGFAVEMTIDQDLNNTFAEIYVDLLGDKPARRAEAVKSRMRCAGEITIGDRTFSCATVMAEMVNYYFGI